jgi:stalled ribosome alternative rescue factor ArfA
MNTEMNESEKTNEPEKTVTTKNLKINDWDDAEDLRPNILRGIYAYGFEKPSPIQKEGIVPMIIKDKNGRVEAIKYGIDNQITTISKDDLLIKRISKNKKGKTLSETFDKNGKLKETILFDKYSHLFKMKEIYTEGKLYLREKFFRDGRLVRSKYNSEGKRIGLYWKKWK